MGTFYSDPVLLSRANELAARMREQRISLYVTGLAASGKTATARIVAQLTQIPLVDSGLPFRLATYLIRSVPAVVSDLSLLDRVLSAHRLEVVDGDFRVFSGPVDITERLQSPEIDSEVAHVASDFRKREIVLRFLRSTTPIPAIVAARSSTEPLTSGNLIQVELKTDFDERVRRRVAQAQLARETVRRSMRIRDARDLYGAARYPAADFINSTHLTIEETVARLIDTALVRISNLDAFRTFRRTPQTRIAWGNPLLNRCWSVLEPVFTELEESLNLPAGHSKARFLLHLSRYSTAELFDVRPDITDASAPETFAIESYSDRWAPRLELLQDEARRVIAMRKDDLDRFFAETHISHMFVVKGQMGEMKRTRSQLVAQDSLASRDLRYVVRDASPELGSAIETYLHYLGVPRNDAIQRLVLTEELSDLPVLYAAFSAGSRKYYEPLLWAFGFRLEEVVVVTRAYGSVRCPRNAMALFLRQACNRVTKEYPHVKAFLTDINPNWGFTGSSFKEAGFVEVGLKPAHTLFVGDHYASRRSVDGISSKRPAQTGRLGLVPTVVMLRPIEDSARHRLLEVVHNEGLYVVPRTLYTRG